MTPAATPMTEPTPTSRSTSPAASLVTDSGGGAASFAGTGSVNLADSSAFSITGNITLEAWVKTTATGLSLIGGYSSPYPFSGYALGMGQIVPGTPAYWNGSSWHSALTTVNDGQWHQLVAVATDASVTLFVDGQADGTFAGNAQPQGSGGPRMLGAASSGYGPYIGSMEDAAIFASALSPAQIANEYNAAAGITHLSGTATSTASIHLDWSLHTTNATALEVQRSTDGVVFTPLTTTLSGSATSYDDTGLNENTHYWYQVRVAQPQPSPFSNLADTYTLPAAPTGLTATAAGSWEVDLSWTNHSAGSPTFAIQQSTDGVNFTTVDTTTAGATTYADTSAVAATDYTYRVLTVGTAGTLSNPASATVSTPQSDFYDLAATTVSTGELDLSWSDNTYATSAAHVWRTADLTNWTQIATVPAGTNAYSDTSLSANTGYAYYVSSSGPASTAASNDVYSETLPDAPTGVAATASGGDAIISWNASSEDVIGYEILSSTDGVTFNDLADVDASTTQYDDWTAADGAMNYYEVCGVGPSGNSTPSTAVSVTPIGSIQIDDPTTSDGPVYPIDHAAPAYFGVSDLLHSAFDPNDHATVTLDSFTQPSHGTLTLIDNGTTLQYTLTGGYAGPDSFTFKATDQYGATSNVATLSMNIVDQMPEASSQMVYLPAVWDDSSNTFISGPVSAELPATDPNGDDLTYSASQPSSGTLQLDSSTGEYTYTPPTGDHGTVFIPFTASDGIMTSNVGMLVIQGFQATTTTQSGEDVLSDGVTYDPLPSLNFNWHEAVLENQSLQVGTPNMLTGAGDGDLVTPDSDQPSVKSIIEQPRNGTVNVDFATGAFTYTPNAGFVGQDWFTWQVKDGSKTGECGTYFIEVLPVPVSLSIDDLKPGDPSAMIPNAGEFGQNGFNGPTYATVHINVPSLPDGTQVTLSINSDVSQDLNVYSGLPGEAGSNLILGHDADAEAYTWTVGDTANPLPTAVYAVGLSETRYDQVTFTLHVILPNAIINGGPALGTPPVGQPTTQAAAATQATVKPLEGHLIALDGTQDDYADNSNIVGFTRDYSEFKGQPGAAEPTGAQLEHIDYYHGVAAIKAPNVLAHGFELADYGVVQAKEFVTQALSDVKGYYSVEAHRGVPLDIVGYSRGAMEAVKLANQIEALTVKITGPDHKTKEAAFTSVSRIRFVGLIAPVLGPPGAVLGAQWDDSLPDGIAGAYQGLAGKNTDKNQLTNEKEHILWNLAWQKTIKAPDSDHLVTHPVYANLDHIGMGHDRTVKKDMEDQAKLVGVIFGSSNG